MRLDEFINEKIYRSKRSDGYLRNRRYFSAISKNKQPEVKKIEPKQLDLFKGVSESLIEEISTLTEKNVPTDKSKWSYYKSQAKKKFEVYPSAYANAWAAKKYKAAGGGWRKGK